MIPEIAYLAAYTLVCDEKIYDEEWVVLEQFIEDFSLDEVVRKNVIAILGDADDKPTLEKVISGLGKATSEEKESAINLSVNIAFADGLYGEQEKQFLRSVIKKLKLPTNSLKKFEKEAESKQWNDDKIELTKQKKGAWLYRFLSTIGSKQFSEKMEDRYRKCLLSGSGYADSVRQMRVIASEDIVYSRQAITSMTNQLEDFIKVLNAKSASIKDFFGEIAPESKEKLGDVDEQLDELKKNISFIANSIQSEAQETLKKKEEAIDRFTISFMGRTKAGKSTLHSVILGGINREFIGKGMERTTRYNRVYQWNGIRIIDTPGIGAPGGKSDVEIAKSVIEESDIICYLVTSDSIQETEFNFLAELKNQNKPVIILLNKKENFDRTKSSREKFLNDPLLWYTCKDKDDIQGHIDRITEYVHKNFSNVYLKIYPVQLKAAQLALTEENPVLKKKYQEGSRINHFLDEIRVQILQVGNLKRSQTILNGTLYRFYDSSEKLSAYYTSLVKLRDMYKTKGKETVDKIKEVGEKAEESLRKGLDAVFNSFIKGELLGFAQGYINNRKREDLERTFECFLESTGFKDKIRDRREKEIDNYKEQVKEIMNTFYEGMEFAFDSMKIDNVSVPGIFDTKFWVGQLGNIMIAVGTILAVSIPLVGVVVGVLGLVVCVISNFFKSKEQKIREAQEKLYDALSRGMLEYKEKIVGEMISEFSAIHKGVSCKVDALFNGLSDGLEEIIKQMKPLMNALKLNEDVLNKKYAARILNYCAQKTLVPLNDEDSFSALSVKHEFGKCMSISYPAASNLKISNEAISEILQEDIRIISTDKQ